MPRRYRLGARGRIIPLVAAAAGEIAGASTIMFSQLGTIVGRTTLAGAATITFTPTALVVGKGALVSATTVTFTPTVVNFGGKGLIAGAATITFTPTGVNFVGKAVLAGASTITFTATSTFGGSPIAGASTLTFTAAGINFGGMGMIAGASTITFTATAIVILTVANDDRRQSIARDTAQFTILGADLMNNDQGKNISITSVQNDINCTAALSAPDVLFTVDAGFTGRATFEYTLTGDAGTDDALVTVPVGGAKFRSRGPRSIFRRPLSI